MSKKLSNENDSDDDNIDDDLRCPYTLDYLEHPITLPCCGRAISYQPFVEYYNAQKKCPVCATNLSNIDITKLPKNINLAYLIEKAKGSNKKNILNNLENKKPLYSAQIHCLTSNIGQEQQIIGQLNISSNKNLTFKTLLIVAVDESGSMSGAPNKQCHYSLHRFLDLTYKHKHLISSIVAYDDTARVTNINVTEPRIKYEQIIEKIGKGGGTRFQSAFDKILEALLLNKENKDVSSAIILFMSDGCDGSLNRTKLYDDFKKDINKIWNKNYVVHTIGFGNGVDKIFMDGLRKIGSEEGAYRSADPTENPDSLSSKINSILDVVAQKCIIPIEILETETNIKIIGGENSKYWCQLSLHDINSECIITANINNEKFTINAKILEEQNDNKILSEWLTYSLDKIIEDLSVVSNDQNKVMTLDKQILLELLTQRTKAIALKIPSDSEENRVDDILTSIESIRTGKIIDKMKLLDLKFEGKFKTDPNKLTPNVKSIMKDSTWIPQVKYIAKKDYPLIDKTRQIRLSGNKRHNKFLEVIGMWSISNANNWIEQNNQLIKGIYDDNKSNPLAVSCATGRHQLVEKILNVTNNDITMITQKNNQNNNALELAIIFGYDKTTELLLSSLNNQIDINTYFDSERSKQLFLTCLKNKYYRTANIMIKYKMIVPTEELFEYITNHESIEFLGEKLKNDVSIETAILKGLYDVVEKELNNINPNTFSWKPYVDIFQKSTIDHVRIVQLLIENKKADPLEVFELNVTYEDGTKFNETTWPLFLACKRGQYMMYSALVQYHDTLEKLNMTTNTGTTMLWIACAGGHSDIVSELISVSVDLNIQNERGDSALIPACQKGYYTIVEMLLNAGADLGAYNKNRDNPLLICCRCGQSKILELLFNYVINNFGKNKLDEYMITPAEIDGFALLHASTELDKLDCIKVCHKFGADLEFKTTNDNKIIVGATALHLASFYGRVNSVIVLVNLGADVCATTNINKYTSLHIAIMQGHEQVVRYLLTLSKGKECLQMLDADNKLPSYYANKMGNNKILEEFFTNKLEKYLLNVMISDTEMEKKCSDVLLKYGKSELCYEYFNITENTDILMQALLNNNRTLVNTLLLMDNNLTNVLKKDEFGVNPLFWLQFMNYDITQLNLRSELLDDVSNKIVTVKNIAKLSPQNGLLCNLQPTQLKLLTNGTIVDIMEKQNYGFNTLITDTTIGNLKKTSTVSYPLMGFIDKLKNNKMFPDGEHTLKYIITDAKYNIIRRIASGENTLQPLHMLAIFLYTSNYEIFKQSNLALKDLNQNNFWFPFVNTLYRAIELIPPYVGEVYRAVLTQFDPNIYAIGNTVIWNTFSVCSYEFKNSTDLLKKDSKKNGIIFIIQSKTGRKINKYSKYPVDAELIFLPNSKFTVKSWYQANPIALAQSNIRDSTFKIREKDIERAIKGGDKSSIIIELIEI